MARIDGKNPEDYQFRSIAYEKRDWRATITINRPHALNAIDLDTGRIAWKVPLGEYEDLARLGGPKTGTENFGGAMATAGGLVFCAGTRDLKIRAFDSASGEELWQYKLQNGGFAPPATCEVNGRQYVVIAATSGGKLGGDLGDAYVAFALPQ